MDIEKGDVEFLITVALSFYQIWLSKKEETPNKPVKNRQKKKPFKKRKRGK